MNQTKLGIFIQTQRKSKGLTQKDLAQQLHVSDKAVSKWERGLSCPDISLLSDLAVILEVSVGELLAGEREPKQVEADHIIESTVEYADTSMKERTRKVRKIIANLITITFIISAGICMICDFVQTNTLSWSWYPTISLLFSWCILMPLFMCKDRLVYKFLIVLTITILPYLYALELIIGIAGSIMPIGICISLISLLYIWFIYYLYAKTRLQYYVCFVITLIGSVLLSMSVNGTVDYFIEESSKQNYNGWIYLCIIIISIITFILGYMYKHTMLRIRKDIRH